MSRFNDICMRTLALTEPSQLPAIISDAVMVSTDKEGKPIPDAARNAWSSEQYDHFGIYSSFNGALAAWATLVDW